MSKPKVTAVGRILRPKNGEPRKHQLIKVDENGKATCPGSGEQYVLKNGSPELVQPADIPEK